MVIKMRAPKISLSSRGVKEWQVNLQEKAKITCSLQGCSQSMQNCLSHHTCSPSTQLLSRDSNKLPAAFAKISTRIRFERVCLSRAKLVKTRRVEEGGTTFRKWRIFKKMRKNVSWIKTTTSWIVCRHWVHTMEIAKLDALRTIPTWKRKYRQWMRSKVMGKRRDILTRPPQTDAFQNVEPTFTLCTKEWNTIWPKTMDYILKKANLLSKIIDTSL